MVRQPGEKPSPLERVVSDPRGQSETFGVLLLLAITIAGTVGIVAFGSTALTETENAANFQRTEHTMTLLDSRSAMVALGDSEMQEITFSNGGDGTFRVDESAGWIKIRHRNFSADESGVETIYFDDLGAFVYENGDTKIAYQGGGAWRIDEGGRPRMISQPEFHYRSSTLTLPIIRVTGDGEAVGQTSLTVRSSTSSKRVFPNPDVAQTIGTNETGAPYDGDDSFDEPYRNPIDSGNITILVHSEFYKAWADYFNTRTTADVNVYDSNETVQIRLEPLGIPEHFGSLENDITIRGMPDDHTITNFTVNLTESNNNQFKHMTWSWYAESGNQKLELYYDSAGTSCSDLRDDNGEADVHIIYKNGSGGHGDETQEWTADVSESDGLIQDVTCPSSAAASVKLNWTAGFKGTSPDDGDSPTTFEYRQLDSNEYNCAGGGGSDPAHELGDELSGCSGAGPGTAVFDQHGIDTGAGICAPADPCHPGTGETVNSSFLVNHYMALMGPNYDMQGEEHSNNRLDEDESSGGLFFRQTGARFLQYLHITENEVEIEAN